MDRHNHDYNWNCADKLIENENIRNIAWWIVNSA